MNQNPLIPKDFKFGGKTQAQLYAEAMSKKEPPVQKQQPKNIIPPKSFGNVVPLIGSDGKTEFTVTKALTEAKKQGKILASLMDADAHVLQNGGNYWTGDLIAYTAPSQKLGAELNYKDGNNASYKMKIPSQFQNLTGETALILPYGNNPQKPNYEFIQKASNLWTVKINNPGLIVPTTIPRKDDWYLTDANLVPNSAASDSDNKAARCFFQVDYGPYLGLFLRVGNSGGRGVVAYGRLSVSHGVLVYT